MASSAAPATAQRPPGRLLVLALAAALAFAGFVAVAVAIRIGGNALLSLDRTLADTLHRIALRHPEQVTVWKVISTVFAPDVWRVAAVPAAIVLWLRRRRADAVLVAIAVLGTGLLSTAGKVIVDRDRPSFAHPVAVAGGQSYPSGHALTSFVACAVVLVVASAGVRCVLLAPVVLIVAAVGASRLALGVHFLSDVVGGWLLGTAWVCAVVLAIRLVVERRGRRLSAAAELERP